MSEIIKTSYLNNLDTAFKFFDRQENCDELDAIAEFLAETIKSGNKILACGNGGSMCQAMHFAEELSGRFRNSRRALPAMALSDVGHMTCTANDFGYELVFSRFIEAIGRPNDAMIAFSTSGNSPNLIHAALAANEKAMTVIGILGKDGGQLLDFSDYHLVIGGETSDRIQEVHLVILHILVELIENKLGIGGDKNGDRVSE